MAVSNMPALRCYKAPSGLRIPLNMKEVPLGSLIINKVCNIVCELSELGSMLARSAPWYMLGAGLAS